MARNRLSKGQVSDIINEYCRGTPISQIAKLYRKTRRCIYNVLESNEFSLHNQIHRVISDDCLHSITELYILGYSSAQISEYLGCSIGIINAQLSRDGVPRRTRRESKLLTGKMPIIVDTIEDEDWIATASVGEIIERMKSMVTENE